MYITKDTLKFIISLQIDFHTRESHKARIVLLFKLAT